MEKTEYVVGLIECPLSRQVIALGRCREFKEFKPGCTSCTARPLEVEEPRIVVDPRPRRVNTPVEDLKMLCMGCAKEVSNPKYKPAPKYCPSCAARMRFKEPNKKYYAKYYAMVLHNPHHGYWSLGRWAENKEGLLEKYRHNADLVKVKKIFVGSLADEEAVDYIQRRSCAA